MLNPALTRVSTDRLTWDPKARCFVAELSDLGSPLGQVWLDSCDEGLCLLNPKTGAEVAYAVTGENRDREGEMQSLELAPTPESLRKHPGARGTKVILFND